MNGVGVVQLAGLSSVQLEFYRNSHGGDFALPWASQWNRSNELQGKDASSACALAWIVTDGIMVNLKRASPT
jgi:hypothetical protein